MMRFLIQAAAVVLLAVPALAQTAPTAPPPVATPAPPPAAAPDASAPPSVAPAPPVPAPRKYVGHKQTLPQRFANANVTHDGKLTRDQATAAKWRYVAIHFAAIDPSNKGYVTVDDIRAFARAQHALHRKPSPPPAAAPAVPPPSNS
jgi:hypothetical protein